MISKCKRCGREFAYNAIGIGYAKEICGPFCDGFIAGQKAAEATVKELRALLVTIRDKLYAIPELNLNNYDHDDVAELNASVESLYVFVKTEIETALKQDTESDE